ncbi:MAG: carbohydrate kinase [Candidatus Coatesbacteria bacterium]|nr:carbohydrate kinase [Candidatus Coatesbacteria bacterium]
MGITQGASPLIFGEILFDIFPDGRVVLGGAPLNVAWHLRGFGQNPILISRIGRDRLGGEALSIIADWGLDTSGVQIDSEHPTGSVCVVLDDGEPRYEIPADQAFDFIDPDRAIEAIRGQKISIFHHGTLAARSRVSASALNSFLSEVDCEVNLDLNLRSPWWNLGTIERLLRRADSVKLNADELASLNFADPTKTHIDRARELRASFGNGLIVVTLGFHGAFAVTESEVVEAPASMMSDVIDTVGAGDAFTAVLILGIIQNWPLEQVLIRAAEFAASICGVRGATTTDFALYRSHLNRW